MLRCLISIGVVWLTLGATALRPPAPTAAQRSTPVPAPGLDAVVAIASGGCLGLALRVDGTVWGWGCDSDWELGATPPQGGWFSGTPIQATGLDRVQGIATGSDHSLA